MILMLGTPVSRVSQTQIVMHKWIEAEDIALIVPAIDKFLTSALISGCEQRVGIAATDSPDSPLHRVGCDLPQAFDVKTEDQALLATPRLRYCE